MTGRQSSLNSTGNKQRPTLQQAPIHNSGCLPGLEKFGLTNIIALLGLDEEDDGDVCKYQH